MRYRVEDKIHVNKWACNIFFTYIHTFYSGLKLKLQMNFTMPAGSNASLGRSCLHELLIYN